METKEIAISVSRGSVPTRHVDSSCASGPVKQHLGQVNCPYPTAVRSYYERHKSAERAPRQLLGCHEDDQT
jgi:hypothetical protein